MESNSFDEIAAIAAFAALAQTTRLEVFRLLVKSEPDGLAAGDIARACAAPHNTMSSHLAILTRAGLVDAERQGRSIVYRARLARLQGLTQFLLEDCCGGHPDVCRPLVAQISSCAGVRSSGRKADGPQVTQV